MKQYTVPVVITISGWIAIKAKNAKDAAAKAEMLSVNEDEINDPTYSSEVMVDEIEEKL